MLIRKLLPSEYERLPQFLLWSIFVHPGDPEPPAEIVLQPEFRVYTDGFGKGSLDTAYCAVVDDEIVGICWARLMDDYGHLDDQTPSLAIAVAPSFRGRGTGTRLLRHTMQELASMGCSSVSLSAQKANPAVHLYERAGFRVVAKSDHEWLMRASLETPQRID